MSNNVNWILHCSCSDLNYKLAVPKLTDQELLYCIGQEKRKSGLQQLKREAKKRNLEVQ